MLAAEVEAIAGAKSRRQVEHRASRRGHHDGHVVLGGRKAKRQRSRVLTKDGKEVASRNYRGRQPSEILGEAAFMSRC